MEIIIKCSDDVRGGTNIYGEPIQELVRCRECKYAHMTYDGECKYCDMWKDDDDICLELYLDGDFYCGFGEREGE